MRLVLRQDFPLGRFHATAWRVNPFDDPHGEWPPSPWRLIRAVTARWYQWAREADRDPDPAELECLQAALCTSTYAFHLPPDARRGSPLRQYHPTEFGMDPPNFKEHEAVFAVESGDDAVERKLRDSVAESWRRVDVGWAVRVGPRAADKKKIERLLGSPQQPWRGLNPDSGCRGYGTSLVQDNYWCVDPETPVWWFLEGDQWTPGAVEALGRCLERVAYFGRAETLTSIRLAGASDSVPDVNCSLVEQRASGAVPVLTASGTATRADIERITDDAEAVKRSVPPGSRFHYAVRPQRPIARERRSTPARRSNCRLVQFALGWNVAPEQRAIVRLTSRFRGAVIRELLRIKTGNAAATWARVDRRVRESIAEMAGKDANGEPLKGHHHTEFLAWCEGRRPTRLVVWRGSRAFDEDEQEAILLAADRDLSWAATGPVADGWRLRLVPLDRDVPAPPGFDEQVARSWESVTPYVPARHHLRGGKEREGESLMDQIRRELHQRGFANADQALVETVGAPVWVAVHVPRREADRRAFIGERRGQAVRLCFPAPVRGPIRLGHSSSFGLGLFRPM